MNAYSGRKLAVLLISVLLLSGCGDSGSSSSGTTPTPTPTPSPTPAPTPSVTGVVSQIQFTSASPTVIGIQGTGARSTSTLTFTLVDVDGGTVSGATVNFSLNTSVGGITLSQASATSSSAGVVTTTVSAGTVPTPVVVTASLASDTSIFAQSNQLVISTGLADQDSFSLAVSTFNPEAWMTDGVSVTLTVYASDHSSNPVPDGAIVWFTAEGGQIQPSCTLVSGSCSVTWTSANRRPYDDGRVTVTATMIGEEGFSDLNGNGILDDTDVFNDKPEMFYDYDEDGVFNSAVVLNGATTDPYREEFADFDGNGSYSAADGQYNGTLCNPANTVNVCSTQTSIDLRRSLTIVMSDSYVANISYDTGFPAYTPITALGVAAGVGNSGYARMTISDFHVQPMPAGSTVKITVPTGLTLNSPGTYTVENTSVDSGTSYGISVTSTATPGSGDISIEVTTPAGLKTAWGLPATW